MPGSNSTIQAKSMPIEISQDGGSTWKTLVCLIDKNIPLTTQTEIDQTYCGPKAGQGPIEFNPSGNLVVETNPSAGEIIWDDLLQAMNNGETLRFRLQNPLSGSVGKGFYLEGDFLITELTPSGTAQGLVKSSFTFTGTGALVTVKP